MKNTTITTTNNATYKSHTFEILKEGTSKNGEGFFLVKDLKARKNKYQIITLLLENKYFHSLGAVGTEEEANKWYGEYTKRYA